MILTESLDGNVARVRPGVSRLTAINATQFKIEAIELVEGGMSILAIDFSEVEFLDSSGIGALVGILKKIGHRGEIVVCGLNDNLTHLFQITRLDRVFQSYPDFHTAHKKLLERS